MKRNSKKKIVIITVVSVLLILGLAAIAVGVFGNKSRDINPDFSRGKLGANGEYVESDVHLYTKTAFECSGLKITPEFDATCEYQIFWYNEDDIYLGNEVITDAAFTGAVPELAKYARIVIYPVLEEDVEKISFFNIGKIAKQLNISVDRYQEFNPEDHYATAKLKVTENAAKVKEDGVTSSYTFIKNATMSGVAEDGTVLTTFAESLTATELDGYYVVKLNCENVKKYILRFDKICEGGIYHAYYYDAEGNPIKQAVEIKAQVGSDVVIEVPEGSVYVCFNVYPGDLDEGGKEIPIVINEYLPR